MSRQQYPEDDNEAQYAAGQHDSYYDQEYDPRQSRSDAHYQDYDENYSQQGGYYEGSEVGEGHYNQQRGTYNSEDSRADYYRQDAYDEYPDAYPADQYGKQFPPCHTDNTLISRRTTILPRATSYIW